jgi:hypothetical protein
MILSKFRRPREVSRAKKKAQADHIIPKKHKRKRTKEQNKLLVKTYRERQPKKKNK